MPKSSIFIELAVTDKGSPVVKKFATTVDSSMKKASSSHQTFATKAKASMSKAESSTKRFTKAMTSMKTLVGGALLFLGGRAVLGAMKSFVSAFAVQEKAVNALNTALRTQGIFSKETSRDLQNYASSLQQVTLFGDETILRNQALLISFGMQGEQLKRVTRASLDMAQAQGKDMRMAVDLLGKAFKGEFGTLSRYGIILDKNIPKSLKFAAALTAVEKMFGGSAAMAAQTYSGQLKQMGNSIGDLKEQLGEFVTRGLAIVAGALKPVIKSMGDWLTNNRDLINLNIAPFFEALGTALEATFTIMGKLVTVSGVLLKSWRVLFQTQRARVVQSIAEAKTNEELIGLWDRSKEAIDQQTKKLDAANKSGGAWAKHTAAGINNQLKQMKLKHMELHAQMVILGTAFPKVWKTMRDEVKKTGKETDKTTKEMSFFVNEFSASTKEFADGTKAVISYNREFSAIPSMHWPVIKSLEFLTEGSHDFANEFKKTGKVVKKTAREILADQRISISGQKTSFSTLWSAIKIGANESYLNMKSFGELAVDSTVRTFGFMTTFIQEGFFNFLTGNFKGIGDAFVGMAKSILQTWTNMIAQMVAQWAASKIAGYFGITLGPTGSGTGTGGTGQAVGEKVVDIAINQAINKGLKYVFGGAAAAGT